MLLLLRFFSMIALFEYALISFMVGHIVIKYNEEGEHRFHIVKDQKASKCAQNDFWHKKTPENLDFPGF